MPGSKLPAMLPPRPNRTMVYERTRAKVCGLIVTGLVWGLGLPAPAQTASGLPPTPPTSMPNPNLQIPPIAAAPAPVDNAQRHRARVTYTDGLLEVHADNSSLNQILREISRQTGMKIVGGVADQRVFGGYGPAPAGTVLQTLLDGTGTNILLQETGAHAPKELVLTPQTGGPTPPPPSSPSYDATETEPDLLLPGAVPPVAQARTAGSPITVPGTTTVPPSAPPSPSSPPSMPQPGNNVLGNPNNISPTVSTAPVTDSVPLNSLPTPSTAPPVSGIVDAPNPPPAGSTTAGFTSQTPPDNNPNTPPTTTNQTSPNGVKTPEQIYEELKQLQQKKNNPPANPQGSSAPQ